MRTRFILLPTAGLLLAGTLGLHGQGGTAPSGQTIYEQRCVQCHGVSGRGDGPAAAQLAPRPRDFTSGKYKIRTTETGSLPTDDNLTRTIRVGLPGTSMPGWGPFLSDNDIAAVAAYVKAFSPRFASEAPQPIQAPPPTAATPETIAAGRTM